MGSNSGGKKTRLEGLLASRGEGSRKECAALVRSGRVRVNGQVVKAPSQRVSTVDDLLLDGRSVSEVPLLVAFHKPIGVLSTYDDPLGRMSLNQATPTKWRRMGLHPVGRLDMNTSGLLLFSSDGQLTQRLLNPRNGVEREYVAEVDGDALMPELSQKLAAGVETSDGSFPARLVDQKEGEVRLIVTEGKYRMVRRILNNIGLPVTKLHRVRYGEVKLRAVLPESMHTNDVSTDNAIALAVGEWTADLPPQVLNWANGR